MFELTKEESDALRSQFVTLKRGQHAKYLPFAFTEQGVAMLSSVLNSDQAIQVNIEIMRTFTKIRRMISMIRELKEEIAALREQTDNRFRIVFEALDRLSNPDCGTNKKEIGFTVREQVEKYGGGE